MWINAVIVAGGTVLGGAGPVFLKQGLHKLTPSFPWINFRLVFGVLLYAAGIGIYAIALRGSDVNVLYPITALGYVWTAFFSRWLLKEHMNSYKWAGIACILFGALLIGISSALR